MNACNFRNLRPLRSRIGQTAPFVLGTGLNRRRETSTSTRVMAPLEQVFSKVTKQGHKESFFSFLDPNIPLSPYSMGGEL